MRLVDLFETPISDLDHLGDFTKPGPFRHPLDKKLVTHPVAIERIRNFFKTTPWDIRLFFCNISGTGKHSESGFVDDEKLTDILGNEIADRLIAGRDDALTVVFLGNSGDQRMPITPWIIAHRMGHAIQAGKFNRKDNSAFYWQDMEREFFRRVNDIFRDFYGITTMSRSGQDYGLSKEYSALFNAIGTQKSSRDRTILRPYEFIYESFAQYLSTGNVTYNPIPVQVGYGSQAWGKSTRYLTCRPGVSAEERDDASFMLANNLEANFHNVMDASMGGIFLM